METERTYLRDLLEEDINDLAALWTDPEVTKYLGGPRDEDRLQSSLDEALRRITEEGRPEFDLWPVRKKRTGEFLGHCGILRKEIEGIEEYEIVYVIKKTCQGRGYATEVARALRDHGLYHKKWKSMISLIDPNNEASRRVAEKIEMQFVREVERPNNRILLLYRCDG